MGDEKTCGKCEYFGKKLSSCPKDNKKEWAECPARSNERKLLEVVLEAREVLKNAYLLLHGWYPDTTAKVKEEINKISKLLKGK